jgi:hypothetical protein
MKYINLLLFFVIAIVFFTSFVNNASAVYSMKLTVARENDYETKTWTDDFSDWTCGANCPSTSSPWCTAVCTGQPYISLDGCIATGKLSYAAKTVTLSPNSPYIQFDSSANNLGKIKLWLFSLADYKYHLLFGPGIGSQNIPLSDYAGQRVLFIFEHVGGSPSCLNEKTFIDNIQIPILKETLKKECTNLLGPVDTCSATASCNDYPITANYFGYANSYIPTTIGYNLSAGNPTLFPCFFSPIGYFDSADCNSFTGWTCDKDNYDQALSVEFYVIAPGQAPPNSIATWRFDEDTGYVAVDSSSNNNPGYIHKPTWVQGPNYYYASALSFNGVDDFVYVPNSPLLNPTNAITVSYWIKTTSSSGGMPISKGNWNEFYTFYGSQISFRVYTTAGNAELYSGVNYNDGSWHLFTATWSNTDGKIRIYKDGNLVATSATSLMGTINSQSNPLYIGAGPGMGSYYFNGALDQVQIWDRALSNSEIINLYSQPTAFGGSLTGTTSALFQRETAVGTNCGGNPNHGFVFSNEALKDGNQYTIYAYALDIPSGYISKQLSLSPKTFGPCTENAQFVSQVGPPTTMYPGQTATVSITMKNTGNTIWRNLGDGVVYKLGSRTPTDNMNWGLNRMPLNYGETIAPGQQKTFTFTITAPTTAGYYDFQWQMANEGYRWFGDWSTDLLINVINVDSAQFISQVNPPTTMNPGQTATVSVTMKNTGTTTWTDAGNYWLGSQNPQDSYVWSISRVHLSSTDSIAPGQQKTFTFTILAPSSSVTTNYNFQWRMTKVTGYMSIGGFGDYTPNLVITVVPVIDNAQFISQVGPPTDMIPGQTATVSVTMKNNGTTTWTNANSYRLGSQNPQDNSNWGFNRVSLSGTDSIVPGGSKTFTFTITAPTTAGPYNFKWKMVHDGVGWFGDPSTNLIINVGTLDSAQFVSQVGPPVDMIPGQTATVSVTMRNNGTTTWTNANSYRLGSQNPQDNTNWGMSRVVLAAGDSIVPGQQKTFSFPVTAPTTPGPYNFKWKMVHEVAGFGWFGDPSTNLIINVGTLDNAQFISQVGPPTAMNLGQTATVSVTMKNTGTTTWTAAGNYRLGSQNPQDNTNWGINRVALSSTDSIAPGSSKTFTFPVTAPTTPGTYNFQWQLIKVTTWFGDLSTNLPITVADLAPSFKSFTYSGDINYFNVFWNAQWSSNNPNPNGRIIVKCILGCDPRTEVCNCIPGTANQNCQLCLPYPFDQPPGEGSCTVSNPNYNYATKNKIICRVESKADSSLGNWY